MNIKNCFWKYSFFLSLCLWGGGGGRICIIHDAARGSIVLKLHASCNLLLYDYIVHGNISVMGFWFHHSFWFVLTVEGFTYLIIILTKTASEAESNTTLNSKTEGLVSRKIAAYPNSVVNSDSVNKTGFF